jgi:GNAT superfamily N-acetyltransferase
MSSAALFDYGDALLSIGMVLVAPSQRRRGLARAAMDRCLRIAGRRSSTLIATPLGEPLYVNLGFVEVGRVVRMSFEGATAGERLPSIADTDARAVEQLDHEAYGANRSALLRSLRARAAATSVVRAARGGVRAFGIAMRQRDQLVVGPLIARDASEALALFRSLTGAYAAAVRIDVPTTQMAFLSALAGLGLTRGQSAPIMLRGVDDLPGRREQIYAIASRGFG